MLVTLIVRFRSDTNLLVWGDTSSTRKRVHDIALSYPDEEIQVILSTADGGGRLSLCYLADYSLRHHRTSAADRPPRNPCHPLVRASVPTHTSPRKAIEMLKLRVVRFPGLSSVQMANLISRLILFERMRGERIKHSKRLCWLLKTAATD